MTAILEADVKHEMAPVRQERGLDRAVGRGKERACAKRAIAWPDRGELGVSI